MSWWQCVIVSVDGAGGEAGAEVEYDVIHGHVWWDGFIPDPSKWCCYITVINKEKTQFLSNV